MERKYLLIGLAAVVIISLVIFFFQNQGGGGWLGASRFKADSVIPRISYTLDKYGSLTEKITEVNKRADEFDGDNTLDHTSIASTTNHTYFGKSYDCIALPTDAMASFGVSLAVLKDKITHSTQTSATLYWSSKGSITWAYPMMTTGDPDMMNGWGINPIVKSGVLSGVNTYHGNYLIKGWAQTNIRYVASNEDVASIKSLADSGFFDVVTGIAIVPATTQQVSDCKASCPLVTARVNPRNSKSTREAQARARAAQEKARTACLVACQSVQTYVWSINGVEQPSSLANPYTSQQLQYDGTDTIYLFKDTIPRIYSPDASFDFFVDLRSLPLLCSLKAAPPEIVPEPPVEPIVVTEPSPEPIICTQEARICLDGSAMPRAANCTWLQEQCPQVTITQPNGTTEKVNATEMPYCGDGVCDTNETCSSCERDCNKCLACQVSSDCEMTLQAGVSLDSSTGSWACADNTCDWTPNDAMTGGGGGITSNDWLYAIGGAVVIIITFYLLLRKKR